MVRSSRLFTHSMLKDQWPPDKWLPVSIAPSDADLEVSVMDKRGIHALLFPVRKSGTDWVDASTKKRIDIAPTHWRKWSDG
ncbi:MAG: hypothetical protein WAM76_07175 [Pseudolabrys sp.]